MLTAMVTSVCTITASTSSTVQQQLGTKQTDTMGCRTDEDCSLSGSCSAGTGRCECDPGWRNGPAASCELLDLGATVPAIEPGRRASAGLGDAWSWGGSPVWDPETERYHLFFSEMTNGCGLLHYQTNSVVRHAVSVGSSGPWAVLPEPALSPRKGGDAWDSGAIHGPSIKRDPRRGVWLLFYMGTRHEPASPNCTADPAAPVVMVSKTRRVGLAWSPSLAPGQVSWRRVGDDVADQAAGRVLSPRPPPAWDSTDVSNAAPHVFPNGSILLGYRAGGDGVALGGGIGFAFADRWNTTDCLRPRPGHDRMVLSAEDGTMWADLNGRFHMLVHRFAAGNGSTAGAAVGGHAFSHDSYNWRYSPHAAYTTTIRLTNGSSAVLYRRERPKPLLATLHSPFSGKAFGMSRLPSASVLGHRHGGGLLVQLFNGAWPCHIGPEDDDRRDLAAGCASFTIATEVNVNVENDNIKHENRRGSRPSDPRLNPVVMPPSVHAGRGSESAVRALLDRVFGVAAGAPARFELSIVTGCSTTPHAPGRSKLCFEIGPASGGGDKNSTAVLSVKATSAVDLARGVGHYLRTRCNMSFAWRRTGGHQTYLSPSAWPSVHTVETK